MNEAPSPRGEGASSVPPRTAGGRPVRRVPRAAWVVVGLAFAAGLAWIASLPFRQADFTISEHALEGGAVAGAVRSRADAPAEGLILEAYLYDEANRYLGTGRTTLDRLDAGATAPFRIPLEAGLATAVARYSLYAGTTPNPFAPE